MMLCWATFIAILGHMRPLGHRLDTPALNFEVGSSYSVPMDVPMATLQSGHPIADSSTHSISVLKRRENNNLVVIYFLLSLI